MRRRGLRDALPSAGQPLSGHMQPLGRFIGRSGGRGFGGVALHGDQMDVEVPVDTGPCTVAEVDADVMAGGAQLLLHDSLGFLKQGCCFGELIGGEICQTRHVPVGNNQQMADRIRVAVQHHEGMGTTVDHERLRDVLKQDLFAEDASRTISDPEDVEHSPGCPKGLHAPFTSFSVACRTGVEANMLERKT